MRHTEFWARMEAVLGKGYAPSYAEQYVLADLGGRTVREALDAGVDPQEVWRAVASALELPPSQR